MTPEENVKIVQKAYADFSRGDIPALLSAFDEKIEWNTPKSSEMPASGIRNGKTAVAGFFKEIGELMQFEVFEPREYCASGDQVIARGNYRFKAVKTGRTASAEWAHAWTIRNGKVTHFHEYTDTALIRDAFTASKTA